MVALKKNNFSLNTKDREEIEKARVDLISQKELLVNYVIDEVRDLMVSGSKSIGVNYSGEMEYIRSSNPDNEYVYVIPKEGTNMTIDAFVIPENALHKENAKKWIDFMLRADISKMNYDYMHYGMPNTEVKKDLDNKELNDESIFPKLDDESLKKYEIYKYLGSEIEDLYLDVWKSVHNS
jgi:spermidine/putrescine-binding protein